LNNTDKLQFKEMLNTLFEIYNRKHADQNLLRVWWHKLESYPIEIVSQSFDKWTSTSNKAPTPYDIILICRNKNQELIAAQQPKIENSVSTPMPKELKIKMEKILSKFRSKA
jgi:hypothetical protein|tara:strand:+ start:360 stop:695 length:336 start_codon:yes stop_codon:yes gene_type:complete